MALKKQPCFSDLPANFLRFSAPFADLKVDKRVQSGIKPAGLQQGRGARGGEQAAVADKTGLKDFRGRIGLIKTFIGESYKPFQKMGGLARVFGADSEIVQVPSVISRFPCLCRWSGFAVRFGSMTGEMFPGQTG